MIPKSTFFATFEDQMGELGVELVRFGLAVGIALISIRIIPADGTEAEVAARRASRGDRTRNRTRAATDRTRGATRVAV